MEIVHAISKLQSLLDKHRHEGRSVGFAPTMGALHEGHVSLMAGATSHDVSVGSIFVNPLQFAPGEDLDAYPRMVDEDAAKAEAAGISYLFVPSVREMYPEENLSLIHI